jgi:hypothetical protein
MGSTHGKPNSNRSIGKMNVIYVPGAGEPGEDNPVIHISGPDNWEDGGPHKLNVKFYNRVGNPIQMEATGIPITIPVDVPGKDPLTVVVYSRNAPIDILHLGKVHYRISLKRGESNMNLYLTEGYHRKRVIVNKGTEEIEISYGGKTVQRLQNEIDMDLPDKFNAVGISNSKFEATFQCPLDHINTILQISD